MKEKVEIDFVEVIATFNMADIALIKSVLQGSDIDYFFRDENFSNIRPLVEPARLFVRQDQVETVQELFKDIQFKFQGISF